MANENSREQKLKYAFGAHPSAQELHVASDDSMFFEASDAKNHASTLEDKAVTIEKRSDYIGRSESIDHKDSETNEVKSDRAALLTRHEELFGQKPAKNAPTKTLEEKIAAEEARLAEAAAKDAGGSDPEPGAEGAE